MNVASCNSCKFRQDDECHRYPPQTTVVMIPTKTALSGMQLQPSPVAAFPNIGEDSWCGEYSVKLSLSS
jgi:hypothetical protein